MGYKALFGPLNSMLISPIKFEVDVNCGVVKECRINTECAYLDIENIGNNRNIIQLLHLVGRIDAMISMSNQFAFCMAVEDALGIETGKRTDIIRCILAEIERISNHFFYIARIMKSLAFKTACLCAVEYRERVMDILEYISGNRIIPEMVEIGGVKDIDSNGLRKIKLMLDLCEKGAGKIKKIIAENTIVRNRCKDLAVLSKEDITRLCISGPVARASGVKRDIRVFAPYSAYKLVSIDPVVYYNGDAYDRIMVRMDEIFQSIDIIRKLMKIIPEEKVKTNIKDTIKLVESQNKEGIGRVESPIGEIIHYINIKKSLIPHSWFINTPMQNILLCKFLLKDIDICNVPLVISSLGLDSVII